MLLKNKYAVILFNLIFVLTSCSNHKTETQTQENSTSVENSDIQTIHFEKPANAVTVLSTDLSPCLGFYVGDFNATQYNEKRNPKQTNRITISLDSVVNSTFYGHSIVAGNIRPFAGYVKSSSGTILEINLTEPGDDKYDGVFTASLNTEAKTLQGTWTANSKDLAVTVRSFNLTQKFFHYDPELELGDVWHEVYDSWKKGDGTFESITQDAGKFNASTTELKATDIENMYKRDLEIMRNAIYARHGYSFKNRAIRDFFDTEIDWYIPVSTNVSAELTELEKKNIELIKRYEQHASTYYDSFGR